MLGKWIIGKWIMENFHWIHQLINETLELSLKAS